MIFSIIISILVIATTYYYFNTIKKTKTQMLRYKRQFEQKGYKVLFLPFEFLQIVVYQNFVKGKKQHGDPFYYDKTVSSKYDVVVSSGFNRPFIQINHPTLLEDYFKTKPEIFVKWGMLEFLRKLTGRPIAFTEGEEWKRKRKIFSRVFHFDFMESLTSSIIQSTKQTFDEFDAANPGKGQQTMNLLNLFRSVSGRIFIKGFFGDTDRKWFDIEGKPLEIFILELTQQFIPLASSILALIFGPRFIEWGLRKSDKEAVRKIKLFEDTMIKIIKLKIDEYKKEKGNESLKNNKKSVIQQLYADGELEEAINPGQKYNFMELVDQFRGLFLGDTTPILITNVLIELAKHPQIKKKLEQEINQVIKSDDDLTPSNLGKLKYLQAVINESFRTNPSLDSLSPRYSTADTTLGGVTITPHAFLNIKLISQCYNQTYFPNPTQFKPQRWLDEAETKKLGYVFTPFSAGPRNCLGKHLALLQAKISIIKFIQRYNFEIRDEITRIRPFLCHPRYFKTYVTKKAI